MIEHEVLRRLSDVTRSNITKSVTTASTNMFLSKKSSKLGPMNAARFAREVMCAPALYQLAGVHSEEEMNLKK